MRLTLLSAIACVAPACAAPPIEMRLVAPDPLTVNGFDLSCAYAVKVRVVSNDRVAEATEDCFDLPVAPQSFTDLVAALRGRFLFDVPRAGLAGVQLHAFFGRCSEAGSHESVVYGGAPSNNGRTLEIPLRPGVSCNANQTYQVHAFDLSSLYATLPVTGTCAAPADPIKISAGLVHPRMLGDGFPVTELDYGRSSVDTSDGTARIQSYRSTTNSPACVAVDYRGSTTAGLTCIRPAPQALGVCGASNEVEVIALPIASGAASIDRALSATYGLAVFGSVWEVSGNRVPIAGATVEIAASARGKVVYVDAGVESGTHPPRLRPMTPLVGATATNASGGFMLYIPGDAIDITIKAANHVPQIVRVASAPDSLPTVAVVLARQ